MSADRIAKLVADLRKGRVVRTRPKLIEGETQEDADGVIDYVLSTARAIATAGEVIDASAMVPSVKAYVDERRKAESKESVTIGVADILGAGHSVAPPWEYATIAYDHDNTAGLITMMSSEAKGKEDDDNWSVDPGLQGIEVEWDRVRWILLCVLVTTEAEQYPEWGMSLFGPTQMWRIAVYDDGKAAYLWTKNTAAGNVHYSFDLMVLLNALNICNASNVHLSVPQRPRAMQKRIQRTGVKVSEIHVRSLKGSYAGKAGAPVQPGTPLTSVRGHFAEYGPKYGKGLLFGRIEGRFWIPQYVRGDAVYGTVEHAYDVAP